MDFYDLKHKYKVLDKAETLYYNLKYGISNFWYFGKVIWRFRTWDYCFFLDVVVSMTTKMADDFEKYSNGDRGERITKQLRTVAFLCERLREDDYIGNAGWNPELHFTKKKRIFDHADYMAKQDIEYLGKTLKHLQTWWE